MLACAEPGATNTAIAAALGLSLMTVSTWRRRFAQHGVAGLEDAPRSGAPRSIRDEQVQAVITTTLERLPANATHWSTRALATHLGMSQTTISRIWRAFALAPHRTEGFKLSTDPYFVDKVRDIVGLYLNPPERALVLRVDEKPRPFRHTAIPHRPSPCDRVNRSATPMTICDTARLIFSRHSTSRPAPSLPRFTDVIEAWSSATSCKPWNALRRPT